jgi:hypothetical protein
LSWPTPSDGSCLFGSLCQLHWRQRCFEEMSRSAFPTLDLLPCAALPTSSPPQTPLHFVLHLSSVQLFKESRIKGRGEPSPFFTPPRFPSRLLLQAKRRCHRKIRYATHPPRRLAIRSLTCPPSLGIQIRRKLVIVGDGQFLPLPSPFSLALTRAGDAVQAPAGRPPSYVPSRWASSPRNMCVFPFHPPILH